MEENKRLMRNNKFKRWSNTYQHFLRYMLEKLNLNLNRNKETKFSLIGEREFFLFVYNNSSQYISPFV